VILLAAGTGLGMKLHGPGAQAARNTTGSTTSDTTSDVALGPVASPPPCTVHQPGTTPELCVSQPFGDGDTVFIFHGTGFLPFVTITVRLVGVGVSPDHPVTDMRGTFNYAVDQGHRFFRGPIRPGTYEVVATAPGGRSASAWFRVNPAATGGPPPGQLGPP
jgi:hypothetical protein